MKRYYYDFEFIEDGSTIDPISVGIISSLGESLYIINRDADLSKASQWVWDNVLDKMKDDITTPRLDLISFRNTIREFLGKGPFELWGWYSDYDHVTLCQLFGPMIDLPEGWPMYTRDLKQLVDSLGNPKLPSKPKDTHHALADATWIKEAHETILRNDLLKMKTLLEDLGLPFSVQTDKSMHILAINQREGESAFYAPLFFFEEVTGRLLKHHVME